MLAGTCICVMLPMTVPAAPPSIFGMHSPMLVCVSILTCSQATWYGTPEQLQP